MTMQPIVNQTSLIEPSGLMSTIIGNKWGMGNGLNLFYSWTKWIQLGTTIKLYYPLIKKKIYI